ncbi:MAG: GxxExxY protein [Acidobacteria bacterium]|nr:GxxExxY protein [Acidobacteriota bacterium]
MPDKLLHKNVTDKILRAFYNVYNTLGPGFLEKVYENALAIEMRGMGLRVSQQQQLKVYYQGQLVGDYKADLVVEGLVILELKVADAMNEVFEAQLMNYLKATEIEVGMILNFGPEPKFKRMVWTNDRKRLIKMKPQIDTDATDLCG